MGGVVVAHELAHTFGWVTIELSSSGYESHMNGVPAPVIGLPGIQLSKATTL